MEGTSADKNAFLLNILWSIILDDTKRSEDRINAIGLYLTWRDEIDHEPKDERSLEKLIAENSFTLTAPDGPTRRLPSFMPYLDIDS